MINGDITTNEINAIMSKYNFTNKNFVEKLLMDIEISQLLTNEFECCIRGGLGFLFATESLDLKRLSIDIDIFTKLDKTTARDTILNTMKTNSWISRDNKRARLDA